MTQSDTTPSNLPNWTVGILGLALFIQGLASYRDPDTTFTAILVGGGAALMVLGARSFWKWRFRSQ